MRSFQSLYQFSFLIQPYLRQDFEGIVLQVSHRKINQEIFDLIEKKEVGFRE